PAESGLNTPQLRDPASNPGTLAVMPSLAQSGLNTFELRDPAGSPGTLAAMPSPAESGLNTPQLRDPAGSPGTLAAIPSSAQSGLNTPQLRDPASQPNMLSTMPPPPEPGPNTTELRDPASSPSTLAAVPGNAMSGAAVTDHITDHLRTPLRDSSWAGDLGQKLLWFASNEKQLAHLTLHPPQLGSIEITLNLEKDGATAHFVSPNADVRGAIETAVPRLREMFAGTGIALGQVSVGSESFRQQPDGQQESSHRPRPQADNAILGSDSANGLSSKTFVTQRGHGLIDIFA
ncbi:flagellar hook-length control protein FliK, partial [Candidatus Accumulibacter vicinus]